MSTLDVSLVTLIFSVFHMVHWQSMPVRSSTRIECTHARRYLYRNGSKFWWARGFWIEGLGFGRLGVKGFGLARFVLCHEVA